MNQSTSRFLRHAIVALGALLCGGVSYADDATTSVPPAAVAPTQTRHQLMKECMRKQKAAISGRENYDLAADCRNITKTEKQNADADKDVAKKPDHKGAAEGG